MFEAKLLQGSILKKALEGIRELINQGNWECSSEGISMQGMDSSHVALTALTLKKDLFDQFRCDRNVTLGLGHAVFSKILKCAANDDIITIKADDEPDEVNLVFQSANDDKVSDFVIKLMEIDAETLGIPDTEYTATVKVPSGEFQRICRDLSQFGDTIVIAVKKACVEFSGTGEIGSAKIALKESGNVDDDEKVSVEMEKDEGCSLSFASRYLNFFTRATSLSDTVTLQLCPENPLVVSYDIGDHGSLKYYLAPKIEED
ncbi:proliferating cell nuclear antigen-like [Lytechinus variegatus]|uniref:proliferating cell nuclear antigen-like n=1 Tax=Lytechinus variegatus TaxID=7654 RepID=UPI001BB112F1|nr:proliferating cell nuclear antigen-like [Lytechinus variegatus]